MPDDQLFSVVHTINRQSVFLPHMETSITSSEKSVKRSISAELFSWLNCVINTVITVLLTIWFHYINMNGVFETVMCAMLSTVNTCLLIIPL